MSLSSQSSPVHKCRLRSLYINVTAYMFLMKIVIWSEYTYLLLHIFKSIYLWIYIKNVCIKIQLWCFLTCVWIVWNTFVESFIYKSLNLFVNFSPFSPVRPFWPHTEMMYKTNKSDEVYWKLFVTKWTKPVHLWLDSLSSTVTCKNVHASTHNFKAGCHSSHKPGQITVFLMHNPCNNINVAKATGFGCFRDI